MVASCLSINLKIYEEVNSKNQIQVLLVQKNVQGMDFLYDLELVIFQRNIEQTLQSFSAFTQFDC